MSKLSVKIVIKENGKASEIFEFDLRQKENKVYAAFMKLYNLLTAKHSNGES